MVNTTSSAVNGVPSENVTLGRSLNSQTSGAIAFHDSASAGTFFRLGSRWISGS
jgi:hypothetical protein